MVMTGTNIQLWDFQPLTDSGAIVDRVGIRQTGKNGALPIAGLASLVEDPLEISE